MEQVMEVKKMIGTVRVFDPKLYTTKKIIIEASVQMVLPFPVAKRWEEYHERFCTFIYAEAQCPYDGERLMLNIIWSDDMGDFFNETFRAGSCVHFAPRYVLGLNSNETKQVERGFFFAKESLVEFAKSIDCEIKGRPAEPGEGHYVFEKIKSPNPGD